MHIETLRAHEKYIFPCRRWTSLIPWETECMQAASPLGIARKCKQNSWSNFHVIVFHSKYPMSVISFSSVQLLSHVWLCDPMDHSMPGLPVHHRLLEFTQTHVHWVSDAIQLPHPLLLPPSIFSSISLFRWVSFSHQVAKILEFHFQHQSFQWIFRPVFF